MPNFAFEGPKWSVSTLTWSFAPAGGQFSGGIDASYQATVRAAVTRWSQVTNLQFREVADSGNVNIRVGWGVFSGGQVGETDYSYQLGTTQTFVNGTLVRLEDPSALAVGTGLTSRYQGTSTTLYEVALHEFGHALGLDHSSDPNSIMFAYLGPNNNDLDWSDLAGISALYGISTATVVAAAAPVIPSAINLAAGQVAVYRFFDRSTGVQFLTGNTGERDAIIQARPDLAYEGLGLAGIDPNSGDVNAAPVYRFFDTRNGTHLFTTSKDEVTLIGRTRPDLVQEQTTFNEHLTPQAGDTAVYRFFNKTDGTHFFTASESERASIISLRADMGAEGIAFYAPAVS